MGILVTHDCPSRTFDALCATGGHAREKMNDSSGEANRRRIARVRSAAAPRVQVHGHHHTAAVVSGSVLGLNLEKGRGSVPICDTSTCSWTSPCGRQDTSDDAA